MLRTGLREGRGQASPPRGTSSLKKQQDICFLESGACYMSSGQHTLKGKEKNFLNYRKILIAEVEFSMVGINS